MNNIGQGRPLSFDFVLEALTRSIPAEQIESVLVQVQGKRRRRNRKILLHGVVWLVVGLGVFADMDVSSIWRQEAGTLKTLWNSLEGIKPPVKSALSKARERLGARAMRLLYKLTATTAAKVDGPRSPQLSQQGYPELGGAFYKGKRLIGMDGQKLTVPDTPANAKAFGRCQTRRGSEKVAAGYPQVLLMRLVELGTHLNLEALIKPACHSEQKVARFLLEKTPVGSLLLWDGGFYSYKLLKQAIERGIPAKELIQLYHMRWEFEIANDELATHQLARPVDLRSLKPAGVVQELYGVLLAHNAVRRAMCESAERLNIDPRTLSFTHALRVIKETIPVMRAAKHNIAKREFISFPYLSSPQNP